jgi:hypothetical protein
MYPPPPPFIKMAKNNASFLLTHVNYELLCDVRVVSGLTCLLFMLIIVHSCIKFAQRQDVYVCDHVAIIKLC